MKQLMIQSSCSQGQSCAQPGSPATHCKQAAGGEAVLLKKQAVRIRFLGSGYSLTAGKHSTHPEFDPFQLLSPEPPHTAAWNAAAKRFSH